MPVVQFEDPLYLEAVYAALFDLLKSATFPNGLAFKRTTREVMVPDEIPPADMPALLLFQGPMAVNQQIVFGPAKWLFTAVAAIYIRADGAAMNQSPLPSAVANYFIWGLAKVFDTRPPYDKQTLGNLAYHCWIEGEVIPEVNNQQIVITVPIHILPGPVG